MKMKIKIEKCADALKTVNGDAREHTYTALDLNMVADRAEEQMAALGLTQAQRAGAIVHCVSGGSVANVYKYSRALTRATLTRTSGGWWLTDASRVNGWAGYEALYLTESQDAAAVAYLRKGYRRADSHKTIDVQLPDGQCFRVSGGAA